MAASHSVYFPCSAVWIATDLQAIDRLCRRAFHSPIIRKKMSRSFANWFVAPVFLYLRIFLCIFIEFNRLEDFDWSSLDCSASHDFRRSRWILIDYGGSHRLSKILKDSHWFLWIRIVFIDICRFIDPHDLYKAVMDWGDPRWLMPKDDKAPFVTTGPHGIFFASCWLTRW